MCAAAATTAVYPTTGGDDVAFILSDSGSRIVLAEDDVQIAKLRAQRDRLPDVHQGGHVRRPGRTANGCSALRTCRRWGKSTLPATPTRSRGGGRRGPEQLATLIYTSGTTGRPKGVELPHRCWTYIGAGAEAIGILSARRPAVPVAAAVSLVRQDAGGGAAADRLPHGGRRPHGQDRREPGRRPADVHGGSARGSSRRSTQRSCRPPRKRAG